MFPYTSKAEDNDNNAAYPPVLRIVFDNETTILIVRAYEKKR